MEGVGVGADGGDGSGRQVDGVGVAGGEPQVQHSTESHRKIQAGVSK